MAQEKHDEAFRRNAGRLVESGTSAAQVSRDLGIPLHTMYDWVKRCRKAPSDHGNSSQNQDVETQLRKRAERAEAELDI